MNRDKNVRFKSVEGVVDNLLISREYLLDEIQGYLWLKSRIK